MMVLCAICFLTTHNCEEKMRGNQISVLFAAWWCKMTCVCVYLHVCMRVRVCACACLSVCDVWRHSVCFFSARVRMHVCVCGCVGVF